MSGEKKKGRPGRIRHVNDIRWPQGVCGGTGPMVDSVGPGSVHHLSQQGLSATLLV